MSDSVHDLRDTIVPKSDQLNADDLIAGPITARIEAVRRGSAEQPVEIHLDGQRPYRPCKGMRRVLIQAWGNDGREWVGRSMTLYRNPEVKYGGVKVGGIEISHLSNIDARLEIAVTVAKGKRKIHMVEPLRVAPPTVAASIDTKPLWAAMKESSVAGRVKAVLAQMYPGREAKTLKPPEVKALHDAVFAPAETPAREPGQDGDDVNPFD
jgi:hypothetical protein